MATKKTPFQKFIPHKPAQKKQPVKFVPHTTKKGN